MTICTENKEHLFGQVIEGELHRNEVGDYVALCWQWLARHFEYVDLDEWIVMPNYLHGIIIITDGRGGSRAAPTAETVPTERKPLGGLVGAFKTVSNDWYNQRRGTPAAPLWQRDFFDHIIRNEYELEKIREYIRINPVKWDIDPDFS